MKRQIKDINDQTIADIFSPCNGCIYWEDPDNFGKDEYGKAKVEEDEAIEIKCSWFGKTRSMFGLCGKILYVKAEAVGYSQYAPPKLIPNVAKYSKKLFTPSPDAVLISCLYIRDEHQRAGLGTELLQAVLNDLRERGHHAVETYSRDDSLNNCSGPTEFYLKNGFSLLRTKKWENSIFSLVRFELGV